MEAVREEAVKLRGRGVGFVKEVGFKPVAKERWSYRCAKWWIKGGKSDGFNIILRYLFYFDGFTSMSGTVSGSISPPTLSCDDECRGFRRLLASWPLDKPKAAVVVLLRLSIPKTFELSSRLFSDNFNDAYRYPVIVFHEETMNTEAYRQKLRSLSKSRLYFQVQPIYHCGGWLKSLSRIIAVSRPTSGNYKYLMQCRCT